MTETFADPYGRVRLGGLLTGAPVVRGPFSFAYDTPGLENGVTVYTPTVGELLLDAWIAVTTIFNGTTPLADIGTFVGTNKGLWGYIEPPGGWDLTQDVDTSGAGLSLLAGPNGSRQGLPLTGLAAQIAEPVLPGLFTAANPILLVVSQDGDKGGAPVGGTAGAASLYIVTVTPVRGAPLT